MRVALYFGSFNPIHVGHLNLANYLLTHTEVDELWFVLTAQNPLKADLTMLSDAQRLDLLQRAVADMPHLKVCQVELSMPKPNYTILTLQYLAKLYPEHQFTLIIGADNMAIFDRWRDYKRILSDFQVMVYPRQGIPFDNASFPMMQLVEAPLFNVSSTQVREAIAQNLPFEHLVPTPVGIRIKELGLYGYNQTE